MNEDDEMFHKIQREMEAEPTREDQPERKEGKSG